MKTSSLLVLALALSMPALAADLAAPYNTETTVNLEFWGSDGLALTGEVDGGTEVTLSCDNAAAATATNDFAADTNTPGSYPFTLTAAELLCKRVTISVNASEPQKFELETYGHANAQHPSIGDPSVRDAARTVSGTATGGSTTTAQDTVNLTQASDDWFNNRSMIIFTSGNVAGHVACIRDFVASTDTVTFQPAAPNAIVAQKFVIVPAPQCATAF